VDMTRTRRKRLLIAAGTVTGALALTAGVVVAAVPASAASSVKGMDVSSHQGNVNWQGAWNNGARFAYVKATEGTSYTNPYFAQQTGMVAWIKAFSDRYHYRTGRWPVIYTATSWWSQCTGNRGDFTSTNPLWVARYASSPGTLPYAWTYYTFWQYASSGVFPGDQDTFNGAYDRLQALANG
jgi:GH25 family lysozyme M1 (1,4-beta-N-acetylmuramidase)